MSGRSRSLGAGLPSHSRRRFLQGLAASGAALGLSPLAEAAGALEAGATVTGTAPVLTGTQFDLTIAETVVDFTGRPRIATTVNGSIPAPTLRWREGDTVTLRVTNRLAVPTSLHWHGILLPFQMDGVPGLSFKGIPAEGTFVYRFKVRQSGTYWYHSHTGFQAQTGIYGAIVIDPAEEDRINADRDYVVQMSDWTDQDPMAIFAKLKKQSDYYNFNRLSAAKFFRDMRETGMGSALRRRRVWNQMRMSPTDLADVSGYAYTFLMNGTPPNGNWTALFKPGERVRLRFISSGAQTFFDVRIPGLEMTVVQADGQNVEPVTVDEFRFGPGETYDVIVEPRGDHAYTIFAQAMDRTGFARGTLAPRAGLQAEVPALETAEWPTLAADHGGMDGRHGMAAMDHSRHAKPGGAAMGAPTVHVRHAETEYGPSVDMRVEKPRTNLDDPGIGLRNNGRRVLTYADLHTLGGPLDARGAEREIELHLTGNMERYSWSLDGLEFGKSTPVHFRDGERLRVILHNDTMMTHPMHLHGLWSEQETPDGQFLARQHTIAVQPAQRVSFLVNADQLGRWAFHCHLIYHMDAGMFREVIVA